MSTSDRDKNKRRQTTKLQEEAIKRFMEENKEEFRVIQIEAHHPDEGNIHYSQEWVNPDLKD